MLVEFSVENYRSIYQRVTLSMEAITKKELDDHTMEVSQQRLLKTSVLYGANASGKSNIFKAFSFMKNMVLNSFKESQIGEPILVEPFLLNSTGKDEPCSWEVIFLVDDVLYRYGFSAFRDHIAKEWLVMRKTISRAREIVLFERLGQDIQVHNKFKEGKGEIKDKLRENSLFISLLSQFNGIIAQKIVKFFFDSNLWYIDSYNPINTTALLDNNVVPLDWVNEFMRKADSDIKEIRINEKEMEMDTKVNIPLSSLFIKVGGNKMFHLFIKSIHQFYDTQEDVLKEVEFDMEKQESEGTKKIYCLAGLLYSTLQRGGRLFIDEI
ncbi:MAG TPA: AAA family ATPase, partial [Candidatus Cloacimonas sp.]|nr:AAA family ATPase [Candidatus Cloacimonas sp.]